MDKAPDDPRPPARLRPAQVLWLAAWCGLAGGELEVLARLGQRAFNPVNRMFLMTRHFVWLVPLINMTWFLGVGALLALAVWRWPRIAGWLAPRLIVAWAVLPACLIVGHNLYPAALLILALGVGSWLAPLLARRLATLRPAMIATFGLILVAVGAQGGWLAGHDWGNRRREHARPIPPPDTPNVVLVVLDTVRADHLSLYGYERPTSPRLAELARRSVRFDQARAAAPWTLASHATFFTGRWAHELGVRWLYPMRGDVLTLSEFLGSLGYATAGFVGNTFYCAYDSGLDRGFTVYRDYVLDRLAAIQTVLLLNMTLESFAPFEPAVDRLLSSILGSAMTGRSVRQLTHVDRKNAGIVNHELLEWLDHRPEPARPFFAFVNYVDAHAPYVLPEGETYRFGTGPVSDADHLFLIEGWLRVDKTRLTRAARALGRDCYDSCVAYDDDQLGRLLDGLKQRGALDNTIVIVTADHGEGLGEHDLFDHGESLYSTELRVPLVIALPSGTGAGRVINEFVSLRDLPATIAELVSPGTKSPFPGRSLAPLLRQAFPEPAARAADSTVLSELATPNPSDPNSGRSPAKRGRLLSLAQDDYVYIRNEGDGKEELFNERDDPRELIDRARSAPFAALLQRFRDRMQALVRNTGSR